MKTFLIFVLSTVLAIGAFLSRPNEDNFRTFVERKLSGASFPKSMRERSADAMAEGCTYHDKWLYSTIEINGKTAYAGVFSRWFMIPESGSGESGRGQAAGITGF